MVRISRCEIRAAAPGFLRSIFGQTLVSDPTLVASTPATRETHLMNYPLLPADAAAYAWQLSCCLVTLVFAMFSWMIGPR
jgi:hypothetical protein